MPCHYPLQAYSLSSVSAKTGKRSLLISSDLRSRFFAGKPLPEAVQALPCGRCMPCRLERSRQVAVRALHESKLYEDSCFLTLTISDDFIGNPDVAPLVNGRASLNRRLMQLFCKRLRVRFSRGFFVTDNYGLRKYYVFDKLRLLGCGEYGDDSLRPHYHLCVFNCKFPDRVRYKRQNGHWYYNSKLLDGLWSYGGRTIGHAVVGDFSFETAAYVARYCTKKVIGERASDHYRGLLPEFPIYSNRPGLGADWFEKYCESDYMVNDSVVVRGVPAKLPRYYDKLWERRDLSGFELAKEKRVSKALEKADDNTFDRLMVKEKCMNARIRLLVRSLDKYGVN